MESDVCGVCGGDGRIGNSFGGSTTTCPSCHGSGRRDRNASLMRDVTKTKPSHYRQSSGQGAQAAPKRPDTPMTSEGGKLAAEIGACTHLSGETKERLVREIIDYEQSHGLCTQTFQRKIRKQLRAPGK